MSRRHTEPGAAGARVYASEAEAIDDLVGWHAVDITVASGKPEWLTCSHPPAWTPAEQLAWGGA